MLCTQYQISQVSLDPFALKWPNLVQRMLLHVVSKLPLLILRSRDQKSMSNYRSVINRFHSISWSICFKISKLESGCSLLMFRSHGQGLVNLWIKVKLSTANRHLFCMLTKQIRVSLAYNLFEPPISNFIKYI